VIDPVTDPVTDPATDRVPLARLFAIGYRVLVDGMHRRLAERGWTDVRVSYGFVLLAARSAGLRGADVAALLGVSKQAASKLVDGMRDAGYVTRQPHATDDRAKLIRLTQRGHDLLAAVEDIYAELESEWAALLGTAAVESLRIDLTTVLQHANGGRLPVITPP
jgi:DNA-binding MarR family transcriptional regulator